MADDLVQRLRARMDADELELDAAAEIERLTREDECKAREIERLRAEVASYKDAMEPRIRSLDAGDGGVRMDLEGGACRLMAEWLADEYKRNSGINYIECRFTSHEVMPSEAFVVTVQRVNGKTPHQLRQDAERELAALRERIEKSAYVLLDPLETGGVDLWDWQGGFSVSACYNKRVRLVVDHGVSAENPDGAA